MLARISGKTGIMQQWRLASAIVLTWLTMATLFDRPAIAKDILVLETMTLPIVQTATRSFQSRLAELGIEDGKDGTKVTVLNAEGKQDQAVTLLRDALAREKPDLVVSVATLATRAAKDVLTEYTDIPQVFMMVADPVGEGFTPAIDKASTSNLTGRTHVLSPAGALGLLQETMGKDMPLRLGVLYSSYPSEISLMNQLLTSVAAFPNISLEPLFFDYVPGKDGLVTMTKAAQALVTEQTGKLDGLWLPAGPNSANANYVRALNAMDIPVLMGSNLTSVKEGALLSLVSTPQINGSEVADLAAQILGGSKPNSIPISRPASFQVNVNIGTARKLGIALPSHILELAGEHVYP